MRSSIVFATIMIIYIIFLIQLSSYLLSVEMSEILKMFVLILYLFVGVVLLGYAGK